MTTWRTLSTTSHSPATWSAASTSFLWTARWTASSPRRTNLFVLLSNQLKNTQDYSWVRGHQQQVLLYNSTPVDFSDSTNITFDVKLDAQAWSTTRFAASATTPRSSSPPQAARRSLTMRTSRRSPTPASTSHTLRSSSSSSQDQTTPHDPASWELLSDFRVCFSRMSRAGLEHHGALPTDAHVLFTVFRDTEGQTCHLDHNLTLAVCAQFLTTRPVPPLYGTLLYFHISLAHSVITVRFGDSPCGLLDLALLHLPALSVTHSSPCE